MKYPLEPGQKCDQIRPGATAGKKGQRHLFLCIAVAGASREKGVESHITKIVHNVKKRGPIRPCFDSLSEILKRKNNNTSTTHDVYPSAAHVVQSNRERRNTES